MQQIDISGLSVPLAVRISKRSRYVSFHVSRQGLEIVLPQTQRQRDIAALLTENRRRIETLIQRGHEKFGDFVPTTPDLPQRLELRALDETVPIHYQNRRPGRVDAWAEGDALCIACAEEDRKATFPLLHDYMRHRAQEYLAPRLATLSRASGLPFARVCVRGQRSRWGSYSSTGTVNLNYKLLFLPFSLVDHVLWHELCHSQHMDHSRAFYRLLASHDADCNTNRKALRTADQYLPAWLDQRF